MALVGSPIGKPWGRRLPVSVGGIVGKTYAEFQTQIATLATGGVASWTGTISANNGARRVTATTLSGGMSGSSWQARTNPAATVARLIQHGVPSQAVIDDQVANGREVYYLSSFIANTNVVTGITRNGFTSQTEDLLGDNGYIVTDLIYWDGTQAQRMNPSAGTGPTVYTW